MDSGQDSADRTEPAAELEQEFIYAPRTKPRHGGSILMAAMLGLAEALGWDPEPTEVTQPASPANGPKLDLKFGGLPPLDEI